MRDMSGMLTNCQLSDPFMGKNRSLTNLERNHARIPNLTWRFMSNETALATLIWELPAIAAVAVLSVGRRDQRQSSLIQLTQRAMKTRMETMASHGDKSALRI